MIKIRPGILIIFPRTPYEASYEDNEGYCGNFKENDIFMILGREERAKCMIQILFKGVMFWIYDVYFLKVFKDHYFDL